MRHRLRRLIPLAALAALLAVLAGCAGIKGDSFVLTQPREAGEVHMQIVFCTEASAGGESPFPVCAAPEAGEGQLFLALTAPSGTEMPASIEAAPQGAGANPTTFVRDDQATQQFREFNEAQNASWPPPGVELTAYKSGVLNEVATEEQTWTLDADLGLPPGPDGGPFASPFEVSAQGGWREIDAGEGKTADRPLECVTPSPSQPPYCDPPPGESSEVGVNDLAIKSAAEHVVVQGGVAQVPFQLDFASSAPSQPSFTLSAASTLPGAAVSLADASFQPGPVDPATYRSPLASRSVAVRVPADAAPGLYGVTLTATTGSGVAFTRQAALRVVPPAAPKPPPAARKKVSVKLPKSVNARALTGKGIVARIVMPLAGSKVLGKLFAPKARKGAKSGKLLAKAQKRAKAAGLLKLRIKVPKGKIADLPAGEAKLSATFKITGPGLKAKTYKRSLLVRGIS